MTDRLSKQLAGHFGVFAVLANVLIDKGIVSNDELADRFRQAHGAACQCSGGPEVAQALGEMVRYLAQTHAHHRSAN